MTDKPKPADDGPKGRAVETDPREYREPFFLPADDTSSNLPVDPIPYVEPVTGDTPPE